VLGKVSVPLEQVITNESDELACSITEPHRRYCQRRFG